ncbi:maleylpyruvate isomerase N-terminal domain-containing protein [Nocardia terpenica]|uniref:maleylpyruvate isomerase N-terminal domain-containing protein n=1 Tax=Nocardia terpenica TaxID=455432 RepID=UPI001582F9B7|nr:maleylpyruvate isomerase N-terminal domain-containing protein [Nocardia terpenica]
MVEVITAEQWQAARAAVADVGDRFAELVRSVAPDAMATRDWTVADTAAHVDAIALWDTTLGRTDDIPAPWNTLQDEIQATDVDTVHRLNDRTMAGLAERDTRVLAEQLRAHVDELLSASADMDPDLPVGWLGGSRVPVAGLLAHLTNEFQIHGRDIARATGSRWDQSQEYAAQFMELFVLGVTRHGSGRLLHHDGPPNERRVAVEFRSRYTTPATLVLDHERVTVGRPGDPVDVRIGFEPVAFNLMMFGRMGKPRAALTGKLRIGGPRPWLLPTFLRTVRFPS